MNCYKCATCGLEIWAVEAPSVCPHCGRKGEAVKEFEAFSFEGLVDEFASRVAWQQYGHSVDRDARTELLRRYELAQRARARNLVYRLGATKERSVQAFWKDVALRNRRWADRIAAKYLEGKS